MKRRRRRKKKDRSKFLSFLRLDTTEMNSRVTLRVDRYEIQDHACSRETSRYVRIYEWHEE